MCTIGLVGDDIMLDIIKDAIIKEKNVRAFMYFFAYDIFSLLRMCGGCVLFIFIHQIILKGWLLDGYPRNPKQAAQLDQLLHGIKQPLSLVFYLDVPENVLLERIQGIIHKLWYNFEL